MEGVTSARLVQSLHPLALLLLQVQQQDCSSSSIVWVGFDVQPRVNASYPVLRGRRSLPVVALKQCMCR